ncbi:MAG: hypothetical protein WCZ65_00660 [Lysobacteraceae bacterium]
MNIHHALGALALLAALSGAQAQSTDDARMADLIERLTDRSTAHLKPVTAADGTVSLELGEGFQHVYLAAQDADGGLRAACVGSPAEANRFLGRNLRTGASLPQPKLAPQVIHDMAGLHGMTAEEYAFYWSLIEQADADARPKQTRSSNIVIINNDGVNEGFNDPTPATPEGGNDGATRGAQRVNVFNRAAQIWGGILDSAPTITVRANFDPLTPCSTGGGVLGSAGPVNIHRSVAGEPAANTWYVAALANKFNGSDLYPPEPEIQARFNSDIDTGCLGTGTRFYYGLNNATPPLRLNLLVVVLHELGHGLGFLSLTDGETGEQIQGYPDAWSRFMYDRTQNRTWDQMTNAQRVQSAKNNNNLLWDGPSVKIASDFLTAGRDGPTGRVELYAPTDYEEGSSVSHWNTRANPNLLMEPSINSGLPLTTDLSRQLMRDIGWFRDANNDGVADTITNVQPSGGTLTQGSNVNITWNRTSALSSRNITIELSTDGGATFPVTIASDVGNTGSRNWVVPNVATSKGRIRVREHDYAAPAGVSAANFSIVGANTAPVFTPAAAVSRQQGSAVGAAVAIGTVSDAQTPAGNLVVTQIAGGSAGGISVSNITNNNGNVSARITASCTASSGTVRFQVSDGSLTGTGNLQVNVSANTPPTLSYNNTSVAAGGNTMVSPASGPADNGSISSLAVQSSGTFTGSVAVNTGSGIVNLNNAAPTGTHTITIRATDNCNAIRNASFQVSVTGGGSAGNLIFRDGFE